MVKNIDFGLVNHPGLYILQRGAAGLLFDQVTEIVRREVELLCAVSYARQAKFPCFTRIKIIIQNILKTYEYVLIFMAPGKIGGRKNACSN